MKPRDYVLAQLHHERTTPVPYTFNLEDDVARRLDAHFATREWRARLAPYMVNVGAVNTDVKTRLNPRYARDGYGALWREDRRPSHLETPPLSRPSFDGYSFPAPHVFLRPDWKEKAFRTCAERKADSFVVANLGWGLFERSWNLRGFENILMDAVEEPDFFAEALERLMNLYLAFVEYTVELPADAVMFGDDWGDQRGLILGAARWREFLKPRWARIYQAVHASGKFVLHHSCGSVAEIVPDLIEIGVDVLESVQPEAAGMDPYELKRKWGDKITFWGGLGSQSLLPFGSPDEIRREVARMVREMNGSCILSPAKPLQPETPVENAVALLEAFTAQ